jgi:hypothetical protein
VIGTVVMAMRGLAVPPSRCRRPDLRGPRLAPYCHSAGRVSGLMSST